MPRRLTLALFVLVAPATAQQPPRPPAAFPSGVIDGEATEPASEIDRERRLRIAEALRAGAYDRAEALLLEIVEAEPRSPEALRLLGGVFFVQGRHLNAAIAFKKAEAIAPLDERSRFTLAMSYVTLGRRDWARPELEKLAEAHPRNALYPYWTARLDYDDGHYATAIDGLNRAVGLDPTLMRAHDNLGLCYDRLGRFDEAVGSFEEANRLNRGTPTPSAWPPLNYGVLLVGLGRYDEAEPLLRESLKANPRFPQAHYRLGVVLEKKGRAAEAVLELEEASRLDPDFAEPQYALSRLHRRQGDREKADRALERFREIKKAQGRPVTEPR